MKIWVDADACPGLIKEILYRAAIRTKTDTILVANQELSIPYSVYIRKVQVSSGFDVADNYIVQNIMPGDLVVTADTPLAALVIDKQGIAINPRGELYSQENIKQKLSLRNFNEELRSSGLITGGPPKLGKHNLEKFANALDSFLAKRTV